MSDMARWVALRTAKEQELRHALAVGQPAYLVRYHTLMLKWVNLHLEMLVRKKLDGSHE